MTQSEARRHAAEGTTVCAEVIVAGRRPSSLTIRGKLTNEEAGYGGRALFTMTAGEAVPPGISPRIRRPASELWTIETDRATSKTRDAG